MALKITNVLTTFDILDNMERIRMHFKDKDFHYLWKHRLGIMLSHSQSLLSRIRLHLNALSVIIWASSRENLSSGFLTKRVSNQCPHTETSLCIEISPVESLFLSKNRITKVLIRLRGCAGWSAPVLFTNPRRQVFSRRGPYGKYSKISNN